MITYTERACFTQAQIRILQRIEEYIARVPNYWGNELRCHELARAVQRVVGSPPCSYALVVIDGKCGPIEHSWLCFTDAVILDAYVPGRLPAVQLIDPIVGIAYRPGIARTDIKQPIVDQLVLEMRAADIGQAIRPAV